MKMEKNYLLLEEVHVLADKVWLYSGEATKPNI